MSVVKVISYPEKVSMPKEEADALRAYCAANDLTVAGFIRGLIRDAITAGAAPETIEA